MNTGRRLLAGAAWTYGAQLLTVIVQLAYSALTSRLVAPSEFGAYAVALAVTSLVALLATGGLGQTVARMVDIDRSRLRSLVTYASILGLTGGAILFFTAPVWAWLWGVDSAAEPIRWLALSGVISPFLGLSTGLMARRGRFRRLALITVAGNLLGMLLGSWAVLQWQSASSLVVSSAVAQIFIMVGSLLSTDRQLLGMARLSWGHGDIGYSGKLTAASMLSYLTGNITKFSMARGIDSASLGYWNRAEVLTSIPFQQIQSALLRTAYPEFRHDIADSRRARVVWTDMLIMVTWVSLTLSAGVAVFIPPLVPLIFGAGWDTAASLAGPLAVVGGLQIISTLLASAVEALGRFRWIWLTDAVLILVQIAAAVHIFLFRDIQVAVVALILTNVVRHSLQVWLATRHGYLEGRRLLMGYSVAGVFATALGGVAWICLNLILTSPSDPVHWVAAILFGGGVFAAIVCVREKLPVVILARKYGFIRRAGQD
jgi:O-antigen/teichoic acid export membrane protein